MVIDVIFDEQIVMTITKQTIDFIVANKEQADIKIIKDDKEITLRFKKTRSEKNEVS